MAAPELKDDIAQPISHLQLATSYQQLNQHHRLDVFLKRRIELQLLRPLDVVADGLHVDAWTRYLQFVEYLHRFQLDNS